MKTNFVLAGLCLLATLLAGGCRQTTKDFTFSYTAESVGSYKRVVTLAGDSSFRIEKYNYYMDNFERKRRPVVCEGRLTARQYEGCAALLAGCDFFAWADAYGFSAADDPGHPGSDLVYQFYFRSEGKEKFVTYKNPEALPPAARRLLKGLPAFLPPR